MLRNARDKKPLMMEEGGVVRQNQGFYTRRVQRVWCICYNYVTEKCGVVEIKVFADSNCWLSTWIANSE